MYVPGTMTSLVPPGMCESSGKVTTKILHWPVRRIAFETFVSSRFLASLGVIKTQFWTTKLMTNQNTTKYSRLNDWLPLCKEFMKTLGYYHLVHKPIRHLMKARLHHCPRKHESRSRLDSQSRHYHHRYLDYHVSWYFWLVPPPGFLRVVAS